MRAPCLPGLITLFCIIPNLTSIHNSILTSQMRRHFSIDAVKLVYRLQVISLSLFSSLHLITILTSTASEKTTVKKNCQRVVLQLFYGSFIISHCQCVLHQHLLYWIPRTDAYHRLSFRAFLLGFSGWFPRLLAYLTTSLNFIKTNLCTKYQVSFSSQSERRG